MGCPENCHIPGLLNNYFWPMTGQQGCQQGRQKPQEDHDGIRQEIVSRWIEQYNYDFDVIEIALRKTVKLANPNLEFIDKIIQEWFSNQLRTVEQVKSYEEEKAARLGSERARHGQSGGSATSARRQAVGNFNQRDYAADFFESFYDNPQTDAQTAMDTPGKSDSQVEPVSPGDLGQTD